MGTYRCQGCGEYRRRPEYRRVGLGAVCSQACFAAATQRERKPPTRKPDIPAETRGAVRVRDRNRCRYCGTTRDLHEHHIAYRSEGGGHEETNLITLCLAHHDLVHTDKRRWQPVLKAYIAEVYAGRRRWILDLERELSGSRGEDPARRPLK